MMARTLRRVFTTTDGGQLLVTVNGGHIEVAARRETWHSWDAPLPFDYADDDPSDQ